MYFILYIQWKKIVKNMTRWRHKTLSASAIRKQVCRCCINFPHELTCQILNHQSIKLGRRAWATRDHGENSQKRLPKPAGFPPPRSVWNQNFNSAAHEHNKKNWTWACDHLKSSSLSADSFQKTLELSGSIPEPAIRSGDTNQRIHCFDSCQLTATWMFTRMYNIGLQAPNLARKCEIKHWYACGAVGLRSCDCQMFWDG